MPVNQVLLVSEEKLKAFTTVNENVSPQLLIPYILNAQETYLVNLIGSSFLKELYLQVRTNSVTAANRFILDEYIGQVVLQYGLVMALPFLKYKILNKSILSPKSETADSIDIDELKYLVSQVKNTAEQYAMLLQKYLFWHSSEFPLWNTALAQDGVIPDKGNVFTAPLVTSHYPYAYKKRLAQRANRGGYGFALGSNPTGTEGGWTTCDGFPWWLWGY
jgi:hypothetical protein